jgi:hypothetical protein
LKYSIDLAKKQEEESRLDNEVKELGNSRKLLNQKL